MIKLKELLELRNMVYSESIKPKHEKKMNQKLTIWDENLVLPKRIPPENDSKETLGEVKYLADIKPNAEVVKAGDVISIIGNSGAYSSGPHLHFEMWHKGKAINPEHHILF